MNARPPFRYVDEGRPDQLAVVFMHAFPYHSGMWDAQRAALRGQARCLAFDAPGLGPDAVAPRSYMLEHLVDDLFTLLDYAHVERALLCGLSLGGYVALRAVQRDPKRVCGLLLADTQAASDSDEAKLGRAAGLRLLAEQGVEAFAEAQLARQLSPETLAQRPELVERLRALATSSSADAIAAALVALATRTDVRSVLPQIAVPTRVIVGADDAITTPTLVRAMSELIPNAELHLLAQAGHISNVEAEPAFNRVLLELVQTLSAQLKTSP